MLFASVAFGQEPTPRALFEEGAALYERGEFERAAEKFDASWALRPVPVTKFNAARSWEKAGKTLKAIDAWQAWLALSPGAPQRGEAESALRTLGERLAKLGLQALTITTLPVQARVTIDGVPRGLSPVTVELPPTRHLLRLDLEGREPVERTIDFTLEAPRAEFVELAPLGTVPVAVLQPRPLAPVPLPAPVVPLPSDPGFALQLGDKQVLVHIVADDPEVRLFRANGNPNGECRTPCDVPVARADDDFLIGGKNITVSKTFVLADHQRRGRVNLNVKTGNAGVAFGLGTTLISLGIPGLILGTVFSFAPGSSDSSRTAAAVGILLGAGAVVGGILAFVLNATTVTFE
ncbi:MAG: PEGA domain-containing protein [Myxococcaceae bacterium]|nr:PEGA domain-containing protein [Myxococcaceae bacterium]